MLPDLLQLGDRCEVDRVVDAAVPARDSRWTFRFPEDTSTGVVPL
jgi:hypothetical protein